MAVTGDSDVEIIGRVSGVVRFPDDPEREGHLGLVGGEDVVAERRSFRSTNEAARWCHRILAGELRPRWRAYGELVTPHTEPSWSDARVVWRNRWTDDQTEWWSNDGLDWHVYDE